MGKHMTPSPQESTSQAPRDLPQVPPPMHNVGYDHSFLLQAILQNQGTLGELKEAVSSIKTSVDNQGKDIRNHGKIIAAAGGAVGVILAIGGFILDKMWDKLALLHLPLP